MKPSGWLWLVAVAAFAVGMVVGFSPVRSQGFDCGNGFASNQLGVATQQATATFAGDSYTGPVDCAGARSGRVTATWGLLVLGVVAAGGALVAGGREGEVRVRSLQIKIEDLADD